MDTRHRRLAELLAVALLTLPVSAARFDGAVPVKIPRAPVAKRTTPQDCSELALQAALAKTRAEMRTLVPDGSADPAYVSARIASDARFSEQVKTMFGNSDLIKSEYRAGGECVVTVQLSLDRLQNLSGSGR